MSRLVNPHGSKKLLPLILTGSKLERERKKAEKLPRVRLQSRETGDLIMMGIGAFTPLKGFFGKADWKGVCAKFKTADGLFWPVPITLSVSRTEAANIKKNAEVALIDDETGS